MLAVTFFQLRGLDLQAQLLRSTLDSYTQTLQLTQALLKGGLPTESDVEQAQAQLEQTRAQLIDLGVQRANMSMRSLCWWASPPLDFQIPEKPLPAIRRLCQPAFLRSCSSVGRTSRPRSGGLPRRTR